MVDVGCEVYWGHNGCDLPKGHELPHRDDEGRAVTPEDAIMFGPDLTDGERQQVIEVWGD